MMEAVTIARPYARAAFAVAKEHQALAEWSDFLHALASTVRDSQIAAVISNPSIPDEQMSDIIRYGFSNQLSEQQNNFIRVLIAAGRLLLVDAMAQLFDRYQAEEEQRIEVGLVSAHDIQREQLDELRTALEKHFNKRVSIQDPQIDPELIGGIKMIMGDRVLNGSYQEKLAQLAAELLH